MISAQNPTGRGGFPLAAGNSFRSEAGRMGLDQPRPILILGLDDRDKRLDRALRSEPWYRDLSGPGRGRVLEIDPQEAQGAAGSFGLSGLYNEG